MNSITLNAPFLWIVVPGITAILLFLFRRFSKITNLLGFCLAVLLSLLSLVLKIDQPVTFDYLIQIPAINIQPSFFVLGRSFVIVESTRTAVFLIYASLSFWFGGALILRRNSNFIPVGLGIAGLFIAAISVVPFLYAALFIMISALASVLILVQPGNIPSRGILRFLTFITLGVPFILIAGWFLTGVETGVSQANIILPATVLIGLGFALFMAIIPFHSWIPLLSEEAHPYAVAFIIYFFPQAVSLFLLIILTRFPWFGLSATVITSIRLLGVMMVFISGIWAASQKHLGRMLGFAALLEIGFTLLSISLIEIEPESELLLNAETSGPLSTSFGIYYAQFIPRLIGLALWALALVPLKTYNDDLSLRTLRGAASKFPLASISVVIAMFSIAGMPLLAGFPVRLSILNGIAHDSLSHLILILSGTAGMIIAALRSLSTLFSRLDQSWQYNESGLQRALMIIGLVLLLTFGLFPQLFLSELLSIAGIISSTGQ